MDTFDNLIAAICDKFLLTPLFHYLLHIGFIVSYLVNFKNLFFDYFSINYLFILFFQLGIDSVYESFYWYLMLLHTTIHEHIHIIMLDKEKTANEVSGIKRREPELVVDIQVFL